jgi:head-tail adaptor
MQRWPVNDPGDYRHQITINKQVTVDGVAGAETQWTKFAACYAAIDPAAARDVIRSGQTVSEVQVPIRMNWMAGVKAEMQVVANGNTYIVKGIINEREMNVSLTLMCVALGANQ